jgi:hypothetical protein
MNLDRLLAEMGWADNVALRDVLEIEWDSSQDSLPSDPLPFLSPESVADACRVLALPASAREAVLAVAGSVSADPSLRALAWHLHHCAFRSARYRWWGPVGRWPAADAFTRLLRCDGRTFYLLILTSGLPGMRAVYDTRRIPQDVFSDTLIQLKGELADLHEREGVWGLSGPHRIEWYRFTLRGELFRLGRIAFQFGDFRFPVQVFRHRTARTVLALAEHGFSFLPNGQANGPGRAHTAGAWTSQLTVTGDGVTGHPVLPTGRALRRQVHLPATEWRQVLAAGDPALYLHFAGGSPLAHDLCRESFERAIAFFPRYFPEKPYVCFCCYSWVLNARLQELLPPTSNMVRFQREVYLLPHETRDDQLVDRILGDVPRDPSEAPRDTALQRALLDGLVAGQHDDARAGACFLLPEDLRWGQQVYLRQELPWEESDVSGGKAGSSAGGDG